MVGEASGLSRRAVVAGLSALALPGCATTPRLDDELAALERRSGGRLGVAILDSNGGGRPLIGHRMDERFGLTSTFKLPLAAMVLTEIEAGRMRGDELIRYGEADMVSHHPMTGPNIGRGMTILALAEAAQVTSDNVAANLLLKRLGGPEGFTARLRQWGDETTRLDRYETAMNLVPPGEVRDTTTPAAMARLVMRIFGGEVLTHDASETLMDWLVKTTSGTRRLRAGLPRARFNVGDKTGTAHADGMFSKINDVAIAFPLSRAPVEAPIIIAAYYEAPGAFDETRPEDEAVLAEVGRIAAAWAA